MALSFTLMRMTSASPIQAFAAGASLCSTSIGTTFTILSTTGLVKVRLGVVLSGAAMMDDVAGLVMVQIISNLGGSGTSFKAVTVVRPILVAIGFALGLVLFCRFVIAVLVRRLGTRSTLLTLPFVKSPQFTFVVHIFVLIAIVTGATFAGTSPLFAAYLSGACISWFDEFIADFNSGSVASNDGSHSLANQASNAPVQNQYMEDENGPQVRISGATGEGISALSREETISRLSASPTGEEVFHCYCKQPLDRILKPLFFVGRFPIYHGGIIQITFL